MRERSIRLELDGAILRSVLLGSGVKVCQMKQDAELLVIGVQMRCHARLLRPIELRTAARDKAGVLRDVTCACATSVVGRPKKGMR